MNRHGIDDDDQVERQTTYTPSSEQTTEELQRENPRATAEDDGSEGADVQVLPGTGGPDDTGATSTGGDVDPDIDLNRGANPVDR